MLPTKLKRRLTEVKEPSNGKTSIDQEALVESESDYESDEVHFLLLSEHVLLFTFLISPSLRKTYLRRLKMKTVPTRKMQSFQVITNQIQLMS